MSNKEEEEEKREKGREVGGQRTSRQKDKPENILTLLESNSHLRERQLAYSQLNRSRLEENQIQDQRLFFRSLSLHSLKSSETDQHNLKDLPLVIHFYLLNFSMGGVCIYIYMLYSRSKKKLSDRE